MLEQFDQAIENYKKCIRIDPVHVYSHLNLAKVYLKNQIEIDATQELVEKVLKFQSNLKEAHIILMKVFERKGDKEKAHRMKLDIEARFGAFDSVTDYRVDQARLSQKD